MKREIEEYHFIGDNSGIGLLKGSEIILDEGLHRLHKTPLLALQLSEDHPEREYGQWSPNRASQADCWRHNVWKLELAGPVQLWVLVLRGFTSWQPSPATFYLVPGTCTHRCTMAQSTEFLWGMCGARTKIRGAGRGGAGRRWKYAGRGQRTRKSTDPKKLQMWVFKIVKEIFVVYYDVLMN